MLEFAGVCETVVNHFVTPIENWGARTPSFGNLWKGKPVLVF